MSKFKDFINNINEERDSDYNGLSAEGQMIRVQIQKAAKNNLMEIIVKANRPLVKLKSAESIKDEYREEDWIKIEKYWAKLAEVKSIELEKLVQDFEIKLNKIVIEMEKETAKF